MMDLNRRIILPGERSPLKELEKFKKEYHMSLCIPSISSSYSICVEYMREWIKDKFQQGYFKSEYITGKNILHDFLHRDVLDMIKKMKPALLISPRLDYEFNRDGLDLYEYGRHISINKMRYNNSFFKDKITGNIASIQLKQMRVTFNIRIKVNSYNHAIDLYEFMCKAFRVGASETRYANIDFQVPKELMLAIANDAKFEIKNNDIVDKVAFLRYLNQNSRIPFMYKFRGTKGEYEFFIRLSDMYIHLKADQAEVEDGEREGQVDNNFVVSIGEVECLFPVPMFYAYFSKNFHKFEPIVAIKNGEEYTFQNFSLGIIPCKNDKGWYQYLTSDYVEDEAVPQCPNGFTSKIMFKELIQSKSSHSLFDICEYTKKLFLSPDTFMEIKLFNGNKEIPIEIDWNTYAIIPKIPLKERDSQVAIYVDTEYTNGISVMSEDALNNRVQDTKNMV